MADNTRDIQKALKKHREGELPKSYYASDGSLYPSTVLHGKDPERALKRDKAKDREKMRKVRKEYESGKRRLIRNRTVVKP